jgi:hypothetical protein
MGLLRNTLRDDYEKLMQYIKLFNGKIINRCWLSVRNWLICREKDNEKYFGKGQKEVNKARFVRYSQLSSPKMLMVNWAFNMTIETKTAYSSTYKKLAIPWSNQFLCFLARLVFEVIFTLRNRQLPAEDKYGTVPLHHIIKNQKSYLAE